MQYAPCQGNIEMEVSSVEYIPDEDQQAIIQDFTWPANTQAVTPAQCDGCTQVCCAQSNPPCCGSLSMQEDDGVTLEYVSSCPAVRLSVCLRVSGDMPAWHACTVYTSLPLTTDRTHP